MGCAISQLRRRLRSSSAITILPNEEETEAGPWQTPSEDLMELIALLLNPTAYIRAAAVCKSWRSLLLKSGIARPQFPWLLFPHTSGSLDLKFFNLVESKFHMLKLPEKLSCGCVIGVSRGWLIVMEERQRIHIHLFNPISGALHELPWLPSAPHRVELSSPDVSDCTVAVLLNSVDELAVCRVGDKHWEVVQLGNDGCLMDLVFSRRKLYVLVAGADDGDGKIEDSFLNEALSIILVHDLEDGDGRLFEVDTPVEDYKLVRKQHHVSYLVESAINGEVLLFQKLHSENVGEEEEEELDEESDLLRYYWLDGFRVMNIEDLIAGNRQWREEGLGEETTMFLSMRGSLCISTADTGRPGAGRRCYSVVHGNENYFLLDCNSTGEWLESYMLSHQYCPQFMWLAPHFKYPTNHLPVSPDSIQKAW